VSNDKEEEVFEAGRAFVRLIKNNGCDMVRVVVEGKTYQVEATPMEFVKRGISAEEAIANIKAEEKINVFKEKFLKAKQIERIISCPNVDSYVDVVCVGESGSRPMLRDCNMFGSPEVGDWVIFDEDDEVDFFIKIGVYEVLKKFLRVEKVNKN
jgi:hypothetical protein